MLTISQLAAYAGVTVRAVRHYHQIGLLPEPERDASGYRRYGATAVVSLIRIRTLANAGVPLSQIGQMLDADASTFADAVERDRQATGRRDRTTGDQPQADRAARRRGSAWRSPPEVTSYLDRLRDDRRRRERMVEGERDGWILIVGALARPRPRMDARQDRAARRPAARPALPDAVGDLRERRRRRRALWRRPPTSWPSLPSRPTPPARSTRRVAQDDLPFDLLDALAVEADPRVQRLRELMRERGWDGLARLERLAEPPT